MSTNPYGCVWTTKGKEENLKYLNNSLRLWNSMKGIQEVHGPASIADNQFSGSFRHLNDLFQSRVDPQKNLHPDYLQNEKVYKRLNLEIKAYNNRILKTGYVNPFVNIIGVPHEVVKRSPLSYKMYRGIDEQVSYERTNLGHLQEFTTNVANELLRAFENAAASGNMGDEGVKAYRNLQRLEKKIAKADSKADRAEYEKAIEKLLEMDKDVDLDTNQISAGRMLSMFKEAVEMKDSDWIKVQKHYDPNLKNAVDNTKKYFRKMSGVLTNGMRTMADNVLIRKHGTSDRNNVAVTADKSTQLFLESIDDAIGTIKIRSKAGSYFPHYILKDLPQLKRVADDLSRFGEPSEFNKSVDELSSILLSMSGGKSQRAKGRVGGVEWSFHKDPIMVGQMYGYDVIGFNKQNHIQKLMVDFTRSLPKDPKVSAEFVLGMGKYMDDIYTMATRGYKDRPDWVNGMIHTLGQATAIRTMGLGFTGSIRNLASSATYLAYFGYKMLNNASHLYATDTESIMDNKGNLISEGIGTIARRAERENGFLFSEGKAGGIATELFTFGLLPEKGIPEKSIKFDEVTGKIQYEEGGVTKFLKEGASWTVQQSLIFHRITENMLRRWMFRTSFINKYLSDTGHTEYVKARGGGKYDEKTGEFTGGSEKRGKIAIERDAINFAINAVNSWAYEYAGHAKSKWIRGVPGEVDENGNLINTGKVYMGALSQSMNMLTHYPHSLVATHIRQLRGAGYSIRIGDWMSPEMMYAYRYAGIYAGIQLGSVLLNMDLNNIAENDTIEKLQQMHNSLTNYDDTDKITRGAVAQWFGPLPDDVRYVLEMSGLKNASRSDWEKILLGNQSYAEQYGDDKSKAFWYKVATTAGLGKTKIGPAIVDGRGWDAFRHLLKAYPSKATKWAHERSVEKYGKKVFDISPADELLRVADLAKDRGYGRRRKA